MQAFSPVFSKKLYVQIYDQIHEAIVSGRYKVGDKLPSEKELCQQFNVSRVPVREALCGLELNGLVESIQGVGVYVKKPVADSNDWIQGVSPQDIINARVVLEPHVAREAALNISEAEKRELLDTIERFREAIGTGDYYTSADKDFHLCISRACGNTMFTMMIDQIFKSMEDQKMWDFIINRTIATERYGKQNFVEHEQIADMIISGDAGGAYAAMKEHMEKLIERYWS